MQPGRTHNGVLIDTDKIKKTPLADLFKDLRDNEGIVFDKTSDLLKSYAYLSDKFRGHSEEDAKHDDEFTERSIAYIHSLFRSKAYHARLTDYQLRTIYCTLKYKRFADNLTMGTGKTLNSIVKYLILRDLGLVKKRMLFIINSANGVITLMDEVEKWTGLHYQKFPTDLEFDEDADIVISTYDALRITGNRQVGSRKQSTLNNQNVDFIREHFDFVVYDESHALANPESNNTKTSNALTNPNVFDGYVTVMTGTITDADVSKIWSQMYIADGGLTFGESLADFRNEYMQKDKIEDPVLASDGSPAVDSTGKQIFKVRTVWKTNKSKLPLLMRRLRTGCIVYHVDETDSALPDLTYDIVWYTLDKVARSELTKILQKGTSIRSDGTVNRALSKTKALQVCSGFYYDDPVIVDDKRQDPVPIIFNSNSKFNATMQKVVELFLEDPKRAIVLFYNYKASAKMLDDKLNSNPFTFVTKSAKKGSSTLEVSGFYSGTQIKSCKVQIKLKSNQYQVCKVLGSNEDVVGTNRTATIILENPLADDVESKSAIKFSNGAIKFPFDIIHFYPSDSDNIKREKTARLNQSTRNTLVLASVWAFSQSGNWQRCDTVLFYEVPTTGVLKVKQAMYRVRRPGSLAKIIRVILFAARNTHEPLALKKLANGAKIADTVYSIENISQDDEHTLTADDFKTITVASDEEMIETSQAIADRIKAEAIADFIKKGKEAAKARKASMHKPFVNRSRFTVNRRKY